MAQAVGKGIGDMTENRGKASRILTETGTNELEVITFYLHWYDPANGKEFSTTYGINAAKVKELIAVPQNVTEIASSPACVEGVFLLRDRTMPLVNLCRWFNYQPQVNAEVKRKWTVIVAELNGKMFGFITHGVDKVHRISWEKIEPPPELIAESRSLTGVVILDNHLVQMVDFENIIANIDPSMAMKAVPHDVLEKLPSNLAEKVVVLADDSRVILQQLEQTFTAADFKVVGHNDGQFCWEYLEGLKALGPVEERVLAVVTDIEMPRMDGHSLCKRIKEDPAFAKIPVVLFSSLINDAMRRKGEKVGADEQITKPEIHTMVSRVSKLIARYHEL